MSPSSQPSRGGGARWLAKAVRTRRPLVWTGRGTSFALAQAFAEATAQLGCPSRAIPVAECKDETVCLVSQSARDPGLRTELLITGVEEQPDWTAAPCITVPGVMKEPLPWLPLPFMTGAVAAIRASLGLPAWHVSSFRNISTKRGAIIVTRMAGPLRTLIETSRWLIDELKLSVVSCDEFGYGMHARLFEKPRGQNVVILSSSGEGTDFWWPTKYWCLKAHVPNSGRILSSKPGELPLDVMDQGLNLLEEMCTVGRIDWRTSRVPLSADWLRAYPPRPRVTGPSGVMKK